ncbi:hypothetical protein ACROYT_G014986 [Oculina patagonica]
MRNALKLQFNLVQLAQRLQVTLIIFSCSNLIVIHNGPQTKSRKPDQQRRRRSGFSEFDRHVRGLPRRSREALGDLVLRPTNPQKVPEKVARPEQILPSVSRRNARGLCVDTMGLPVF